MYGFLFKFYIKKGGGEVSYLVKLYLKEGKKLYSD